MDKGHWIKKYPDQEGLWWVTLSWSRNSVELVTVRNISNGVMVIAMGSFLYPDDIAATWSEPVIAPDIFEENG